MESKPRRVVASLAMESAKAKPHWGAYPHQSTNPASDPPDAVSWNDTCWRRMVNNFFLREIDEHRILRSNLSRGSVSAMSMLRQEDENSAGPTRSTCGFGGRDSREAPLVATEETPDDDDTASEDMEDYAREAVREVEEIERQHRAAYGGGSDARSVMAQCGSDSGDRSDPEATQGDM